MQSPDKSPDHRPPPTPHWVVSCDGVSECLTRMAKMITECVMHTGVKANAACMQYEMVMRMMGLRLVPFASNP
jgi:hypothetical protein